jgi:hypothetical protein
MKMGTIAAPWRYDCAAGFALWRAGVSCAFRIGCFSACIAPVRLAPNLGAW